MAFITGTAADYLDLLDVLEALATGRHVASVTLVSGGTLYTAGDILTMAGGTFTVPATIEVLTVDGGGVILTYRLVQNGSYTVDPTDPDTPTDGTGSGAQFNSTSDDGGWTTNRKSFAAVSAVMDTPGTLYQVNEILTVVGGTFIVPAQFKVLTVDGGGGIATVSIEAQIGEYTVAPSNPVNVTGAQGSGGKLTLTFSDERALLLQGIGSGADEIFVGIRTFADGSAHNWEISGQTGYQSGSEFRDQPGISPGRYNQAQHGSYVPLNNAPLTYWLDVSGRRIIGVFKMGSTYTNLYLGFINPFGTTLEYPYPLLVMGCSSLWNRIFSSGNIGLSGMTDPIGHQLSTTAGPGSIRDPGGSWIQLINSESVSGGRTPRQDCVVYPAGQPHHTGIAASDLGGNGVWTFDRIVPNNAAPGSQTVALFQTPGTPDFVSPIFPATIIEASPVRQALGEMDDVYWISANGEVTDLLAEDTIEIDGEVYTVFQNCNRTDVWAFFALKKE